jgi:NAD(P)-dependent dehydrogenase (short-subunit alcohol dehydrogenase family)
MMTTENEYPLQGKIALVAGATRGAGRGMAVELGRAGATVYCTGRSSRYGQKGMADRPETIEETAELVTAAGGVGIAVRCDHIDEAQVKALFAQVQQEQGHLDILINDVWGGDVLTEWGTPFWDLDMTKGLTMLERAIHTHIITSRYGVPLMLERDQGLILEITDGDTFNYRGNLFYDLVKTSVIRLAYGMAEELKGRNITALALTPGFLRSEEMLDHFGVTEANWRDGVKKDPHFIASETPTYIGRAVVALASDPQVARWAGQSLATWTLMHEYGFTDADGSQPDWGTYFTEKVMTIS